jgi:hypothetical protein
MLPQMIEAQCREFAEDVVYEEIENAGHWIPEERPEAFVKLLQRKNIPPRHCQVTDEYRGMPDVLPLAANRDVRDKPVFSRRPERVVPKLTRIPLELAVPAVTQRDAEPVAVLRCRFGQLVAFAKPNLSKC